MTVSVIVPTYNYAQLLPAALTSLLAQSYTDWECVIVDDGSTDDTAAVVGGLVAQDPRLRYVAQENLGQLAARNRGISETTGAYVQFLDADDLLPPTKLEAQVRLLDAQPEIGIVYSDVRYFRETPTKLLRHRLTRRLPSSTGVPDGHDPLLRALVERNLMVIEGPLARRTVLTSVGKFDEGRALTEDWQLWLRCALAGVRFAGDPAEERAVLVRAHARSSSHNLASMHDGELAVRKWLASQLTDPDLVELNRRRTEDVLARIAVLRARTGPLRPSVRHLMRAGLAERRLDWLLLACGLPLLRLPGRDRLLGLRRRLLRRPGL